MLQATAVVYMRPVYGDTYLIHYGPRLVTRSCTVPSQSGWTSAARFAYCNSRHSNYQYDPMPLDFCKTCLVKLHPAYKMMWEEPKILIDDHSTPWGDDPPTYYDRDYKAPAAGACTRLFRFAAASFSLGRKSTRSRRSWGDFGWFTR